MRRWLIAYDICQPKRLRRVAKRLEQSAVRVQKSVFLYVGTRAELKVVLADLTGLIDLHEDRIESWPIRRQRGSVHLRTGHVFPGVVACAVLSPTGIDYVEQWNTA